MTDVPAAAPDPYLTPVAPAPAAVSVTPNPNLPPIVPAPPGAIWPAKGTRVRVLDGNDQGKTGVMGAAGVNGTATVTLDDGTTAAPFTKVEALEAADKPAAKAPNAIVHVGGRPLSMPLVVRDQDELEMSYLPEHVVWTSSDPAIAKVQPTGNAADPFHLVGVAEGQVEVFATVSVGGHPSIMTGPVVVNVVTQVPTTAEIPLPVLEAAPA
jgi:hypothetical protein